MLVRKKIWVNKKILVKKMLLKKKFWSGKNCWSEKRFCSKKILVKKICPKKIFVCKKIFGLKAMIKLATHSHWKNIPDRFVTDSKKILKSQNKFRCIFFYQIFFGPNWFWPFLYTKSLASLTNLRNVLHYDFAQFFF